MELPSSQLYLEQPFKDACFVLIPVNNEPVYLLNVQLFLENSTCLHKIQHIFTKM